MSEGLGRAQKPPPSVVNAEGNEPLFKAGDAVKVSVRFPIGHFRVPNYIRGKRGFVESVIKPAAVNNEDEGFGLNAGVKRHYYRIAIPLKDLWPKYIGSPKDGLRIEVFETWLERN
ncbi:MAG: SH3-like domain-containing protein [Methylocella sp.]